MNIEAINAPVKNVVEVGDLLVFHDTNGAVQSAYIVCFNEYDEEYYVQNLDGTKSKMRGYNNIANLMRGKTNVRVLKKKDVTLKFDLNESFGM